MTYRDETDTMRAELAEAHRKIAKLSAPKPREVIVWRENGAIVESVRSAITMLFSVALLLALSAGGVAARNQPRAAIVLSVLATLCAFSGAYTWWRSLPREVQR